MLLVSTLATLVIHVSTPAPVAPTLVDRVLAEADAIWRPTGLTLIWNRAPRPSAGATLDVVIGDARGQAHSDSTGEPLGWIEFENGVPLPRLYVSYANAVVLLEESPGVVGRTLQMPPLERDTYLGRAMGRALAHELGHYLLASKAHARSGLMQATQTAWQFFVSRRPRLELTREQRMALQMRMEGASLVASRVPGSTAAAANPSSTSDSSTPTCPTPASMPPAESPPRPPTLC